MSVHMSKQQLAAAIWNSANNMRSKIEASEYKDLILGFIFYKFLSARELSWLKENDWEDEDIRALVMDADGNPTEDVRDDVEDIRRTLGYFIPYDDLYSTWIEAGADFEFKDVTEGISRFNRFVHRDHRRLYEGIFLSLAAALPKLGDTDPARRKAVRKLLLVIDPIPTDGRQGYDVLGFVYEYLLKQFASNAGSKAGEFYTPAAVSQLKAEIIADHLRGADEIKIFDGAAGSSSLLLNIGRAVARRSGEPDKIRYYAQEYKESTYNLTRMNLCMHGIRPGNIVTRRGDTLDADDWPISEATGSGSADEGLPPLLVDACAENPPYSQAWDTAGRGDDPRFRGYGVAPKSKADYAFLLQGLYHLRPGGIMTIILPHGVLFRGGDEEAIRKNLIEKDQIDAVIGLPANIFYGTGIPTLIMVLKKQRDASDIMVIDASKGFVKAGTKNELRACDIRRAFDAYRNRAEIPGYAHLATKDEVRANGYNLNIPRYVDSSEPVEPVDVYASMFGGIPAAEVDALGRFWDVFPGLREFLFPGTGESLRAVDGDIARLVDSAPCVVAWRAAYEERFADFGDVLYGRLIEHMDAVNPAADEEALADEVFARMAGIGLVDPYDGYQALDDAWGRISGDVELLQAGGLDEARAVDEVWTTRSKDGRDERVMEGYAGRILPLGLVQRIMLPERLAEVAKAEARGVAAASRLSTLLAEAAEEEPGAAYLKDDGSAFVPAALVAEVALLASEDGDPAMDGLDGYLALLEARASKTEKIAYVAAHPEVPWHDMEPNKDGTYGKPKSAALLKRLRAEHRFEPGTTGARLAEAAVLLDEEKASRKRAKDLGRRLEDDTRALMGKLTDGQVRDLLREKWIAPLCERLARIPDAGISDLVGAVKRLRDKYAVTYSELDREIAGTEEQLARMIGELMGGERDMAGLAEFARRLSGE